MMFEYKPIKYNYSSRNGHSIKFLVIHDTGNTARGSGAENHYKYFGGGNRDASAHYFVDDKGIIQIIGDSKASWAVGDNQGHGRALNGATNQNSISIELCVNSDGDYDKAFQLTVDLAREIMKEYNIPLERVVRHYDVSRKSCPYSMKSNNWAKWYQFKDKLKDKPTYQINIKETSPITRAEKEVDSMNEQEIRKIIQDEVAKIMDKGDNFTWADKHFNYLKENGVEINEKRYNDYITRGAVFKLLEEVLKNAK